MRVNIKHQIKEAFSSKKNLNSSWSPDTQPNNYALDIFLRKSGYKLVDIIPQGDTPELLIEPIKSDFRHPDITHMVAEGTFYMKMKSYGEIDSSDLNILIEIYQSILAILLHLEGLDLSKLEYTKE